MNGRNLNLKSIFRRLSVRLTLLVFVLIAVPVGIALGILEQKLKDDFRQSALQQLNQKLDIKLERANTLLELAAGEVNAIVNEFAGDFKKYKELDTNFVEGVVTPAFFNSELYRELSSDLKKVMETSRYYLQARILDSTGQEIIRFNRSEFGPVQVPEEKLQNKSKRYYIRRIVDGSNNTVHIASVSLNMENGEVTLPHTPMLRIGKKILLEDGRLFGIMVLNVHTNIAFGSLLSGEGSSFLVIDEEGKYLHHWKEELLFGKDLGHGANLLEEEPELKANLKIQDAKIHYDPELEEFRIWKKLYFDKNDTSTYWVFMERQQESSILAPWFVPVEQGTTGLLIIFILGFSIYLVFAHKSLAPLNELTDAIREMEKGELSARVKVTKKTEIGDIGAAFNSMARGLEESIEKQKVTMDKLEKANEEMKTFTNIVSHDLRSPLLNLKGFSGELKEAFRDIRNIVDKELHGLTEEQRNRINELFQDEIPESFGFIDSSTNAMERLVSSIMALARIGARKMIPVEVDTATMIDEKLKSMHHQIEERKVEIKVNHLPPVVADLMSLDQIFGNILSNAIKFLDPGRRGVIEISGERRFDDTLFKVEDNGTGIPGYGKDKVFALFRRAVGHDIPGEGMGLAYVKALVERHEGEIWFESREGKGTTFFFTIPNKIKILGDKDG